MIPYKDLKEGMIIKRNEEYLDDTFKLNARFKIRKFDSRGDLCLMDLDGGITDRAVNSVHHRIRATPQDILDENSYAFNCEFFDKVSDMDIIKIGEEEYR